MRPKGRYDTVNVSFSNTAARMFGATSGKAHHISMADSPNTEIFMAFLEKMQNI